MIINKTKAGSSSNNENFSTEELQYTPNPLVELFEAVKEILLDVRYDETDPNSPKIFNKVMLNTGQLSRIKNNKHNTEDAIRFPAVLVHFINVRYLVQQSRIGEGRATLRIQYILNRLNPGDEEHELDGFRVFQKINIAIQDGKSKYDALNERVQLTYFDQPESFGNGLQPYWIDYEVWFRDTTAYKYRNYVDVHLVAPPFTNHSDQLPENSNGHEDHNDVSYEDASSIQGTV